MQDEANPVSDIEELRPEEWQLRQWALKEELGDKTIEEWIGERIEELDYALSDAGLEDAILAARGAAVEDKLARATHWWGRKVLLNHVSPDGVPLSSPLILLGIVVGIVLISSWLGNR